MRGILTVFRKEFLENLRDRRTIFSALLFGPLFGPLFFVLMINVMQQQAESRDEQKVEVAVSGGAYAPNLLALFAERGITVKPVTLDEAGAGLMRSEEHTSELQSPTDLSYAVSACERSASGYRSII